MGLMIDIDKTILLFVEGGMQAIYLYDLSTEQEMGRILANETFSNLVQFSSSKQANKAIFTYSGITCPRKVYEAKYDQQTQQVTTSIITSRFADGSDQEDINLQDVALPTISGNGTKENSYTIFSKKTLAGNAIVPALMHISHNVDQSSYLWSPDWYSFMSQFDGRLILVNFDIGFDDDGQLRLGQESIDKIKAVAQDVIKRKFVAPGKLIIEGKEEAMAAAIALNLSPENTFGALLVEDGIFDLFLYERMLNNSSLSGKIDMDRILHFSPLQNINKTFQRYPATFIISQKDDPTWDSQSMKYIAQLQDSYSNNSLPMLLLLDEKYNEKLIDQQCFLQLALDLKGQDNSQNILGSLSISLNG